MIHEQRSPEFWRNVGEHPQVAPHVMFDLNMDMGEVAQHQAVTPLASEHGGFLFFRLDGLGKVFELHTLYLPEGWGREVLKAAKEAARMMFSRGADLLITYSVEDHWRSRPPLSFGWSPVGGYRDAPPFGRLKMWLLTSDAWYASPACRRGQN